jgi:hypothetical protein
MRPRSSRRIARIVASDAALGHARAYGPGVKTDTRKVWPPQLVDVLDDGEWRRAQLDAWKRSDIGLQASIRYCATPGYGLTCVEWVDRIRVRTRRTSRVA